MHNNNNMRKDSRSHAFFLDIGPGRDRQRRQREINSKFRKEAFGTSFFFNKLRYSSRQVGTGTTLACLLMSAVTHYCVGATPSKSDDFFVPVGCSFFFYCPTGWRSLDFLLLGPSYSLRRTYLLLFSTFLAVAA